LQQWSGPLPPPEAIERYEVAVSGAARAILEMAVKNNENRISLEQREMSIREGELVLDQRDMGIREFSEKLGLVLTCINRGYSV